jgi:dodecin
MDNDHTYVVNEIVGTSTDNVNDAIRNGIQRASRTIRNLDWFEVVSVRGAILDGEISHYQVTMKVGFRLEDPQPGT